MKSLLDAGTRNEVLGRLMALRSDSCPAWGRMEVCAMLCHLAESLRMALGELKVASKRLGPFRVFPLKHFVLYLMPFPKGVPTAPELIARKSEGFETDLATVRELTRY